MGTRSLKLNTPEKTVDMNPSKKTDTMENKAIVNLIQTAQNSALDLQSVTKYILAEVSLSLFHLDGTIKKPMKCNLLGCFNFDSPDKVEKQVSILDMGLLWRAAVTTKEDRQSYDG